MKLVCQTILGTLFLLSCISDVVAQKIEPLPPRQLSEFIDAQPLYCWENLQRLDIISMSTPANETIIVISRLGDKDLKPNLNKRRLHNVRAFWTQQPQYSSPREPKTVIVAEGEPTKGYGQIEFYVGGRLVDVLKARSNQDFNTGDCYAGADGEPPCAEEWQQLFYPCRDEVEKSKQKRKVVLKKKKPRQ